MPRRFEERIQQVQEEIDAAPAERKAGLEKRLARMQEKAERFANRLTPAPLTPERLVARKAEKRVQLEKQLVRIQAQIDALDE